MAIGKAESPGLHRIFRRTAGWTLLGVGVLTVAYSVWAYSESRAYLDDVENSGQKVEAFDAANYLMTSSGLYLLIGVLLAALSGLYLARPTGAPDTASVNHQDNPTSPTPSKTTQSSTEAQQASAPNEEDELDELLRRIDDKA